MPAPVKPPKLNNWLLEAATQTSYEECEPELCPIECATKLMQTENSFDKVLKRCAQGRTPLHLRSEESFQRCSSLVLAADNNDGFLQRESSCESSSSGEEDA